MARCLQTLPRRSSIFVLLGTLSWVLHVVMSFAISSLEKSNSIPSHFCCFSSSVHMLLHTCYYTHATNELVMTHL